MACFATVDQVKLMYKGVPEDGFYRDVEFPAAVLTQLHKKTGMDFDQQSLTVKGLQIVRGPHCSTEAFRSNKDQHLLQNWETEDFIVFENIYYGSYSSAINKTMKGRLRFPVYICDKIKPHTRFFKAGLFQIIQSITPDIMTVNANGFTIRGYLLLQKYEPPLSEGEEKRLVQESKTLSKDLDHDMTAPRNVQAPPLPPLFQGTPPELLARRKEDQQPPKRTEEPQGPVPRPTETLGMAFKSLLEARFATFLHHMGLEYTYEKTMFSLETYDRVPGSTHTYHPDFYIKPLRLHIELKPHFPHLEELDMCEQLAALGYDVVLFYGTDFVPLYQNYASTPGLSKRHYNQQDALRGMGWSAQSGQRLPGEAVFVDHGPDGPVTIECIVNTRHLPVHKIRSPRILAAFETARQLK